MIGWLVPLASPALARCRLALLRWCPPSSPRSCRLVVVSPPAARSVPMRSFSPRCPARLPPVSLSSLPLPAVVQALSPWCPLSPPCRLRLPLVPPCPGWLVVRSLCRCASGWPPAPLPLWAPSLLAALALPWSSSSPRRRRVAPWLPLAWPLGSRCLSSCSVAGSLARRRSCRLVVSGLLLVVPARSRPPGAGRRRLNCRCSRSACIYTPRR